MKQLAESWVETKEEAYETPLFPRVAKAVLATAAAIAAGWAAEKAFDAFTDRDTTDDEEAPDIQE